MGLYVDQSDLEPTQKKQPHPSDQHHRPRIMYLDTNVMTVPGEPQVHRFVRMFAHHPVPTFDHHLVIAFPRGRMFAARTSKRMFAGLISVVRTFVLWVVRILPEEIISVAPQYAGVIRWIAMPVNPAAVPRMAGDKVNAPSKKQVVLLHPNARKELLLALQEPVQEPEKPEKEPEDLLILRSRRNNCIFFFN